MEWSPQQEQALAQVSQWMRDPDEQVFYLAGYAGTGKTTLAKHLVEDQDRRWLFAAFTGKASHVLRQKGCYGAQTIHSLIYRPSGTSKATEIAAIDMKLALLADALLTKGEYTAEEKTQVALLTRTRAELQASSKPRFTLWTESPLMDAAGIVVDEVSMVDEYVGRDLESFGKKILVLGDPAQLPPVGGGGYFTRRTPDIVLTEVHRHARESGILRLATMIREGQSPLDFKELVDDCHVMPISSTERAYITDRVMNSDQVLCGLNATRHVMNKRQRELMRIESAMPVRDERLICLRNNHNEGLFNGSQWRVIDAEIDEEQMLCSLHVASEEDEQNELYTVSWLHHFLGQGEELKKMSFGRRDQNEFDFSYALTVHKSQGSQWDDVVLFDESRAFRQDRHRWLYTGITRAAKRLTVFI